MSYKYYLILSLIAFVGCIYAAWKNYIFSTAINILALILNTILMMLTIKTSEKNESV